MASQILDETRTPCPNGGSSANDGGDWLMGGIPVIPEVPLSECDARGILERYLSGNDVGRNYDYQYFGDGIFSGLVAGRYVRINVASGTAMRRTEKHQSIAPQYVSDDCGGGSGYSKVD